MRSLVEQLPPGFAFAILTRDRDHTATEPYPGVPTDRWVPVERASVRYLSPADENPRAVARLAREAAADVVLLNGVFSRLTIKYLLARRLGLAPRLPLVVAPRGELSPGALGIRGGRKRTFLRIAGLVGLHAGATWQASTEQERDWILGALPGLPATSVVVAPDPGALPPPGERRPSTKEPGQVRLVHVSRIAPMKNLAFALRALAGVHGEVSLDVYGTADDEPYWLECQAEMARLPSNVSARYRGALAPDEVLATFAAHDFSVLPTLGENFGHVILESLLAGCPVVLSDRTSWPDLAEAGAGFTLPLEDPGTWTRALQACVDMSTEDHERMSARSPILARAVVAAGDAVARNVALFEEAARR